MTPYIVNLTNHLICKNRYDNSHPFREDYIKDVANDLLFLDVASMSPATLGKILCSLEPGDVPATKTELLGALHFNGKCEDTLRELVAYSLAHVIRERQNPYTINEGTVLFSRKP